MLWKQIISSFLLYLLSRLVGPSLSPRFQKSMNTNLLFSLPSFFPVHQTFSSVRCTYLAAFFLLVWLPICCFAHTVLKYKEGWVQALCLLSSKEVLPGPTMLESNLRCPLLPHLWLFLQQIKLWKSFISQSFLPLNYLGFVTCLGSDHGWPI